MSSGHGSNRRTAMPLGATSNSFKHSCSESVLPSAYEEGGLLTVMSTTDSTTHRCRTTQIIATYRRISVPVSETERPTGDLLAWHNQNVLLQ